jgi:2-keto-4-pentenoate hydratase/2-oxohepta-3-ene-1,7-dioic acid hydratase in catechol pathway
VQVFTTAEGVIRRDHRGSVLLKGVADLDEVLAGGQWDRLADLPADGQAELQQAVFTVPVRPATIVAVGLNYRSHADEVSQPVPDAPMFGAMDGQPVSACDEVVTLPAQAPGCVDYEGEIAVVMARRAYRVPAKQAWSVVAGLAAINDVTARDVQMAAVQRGDLAGITASKAFPGFKPFGPGIMTVSGSASDTELITRVNGEVRQRAALGDLLFGVPTLVEAITATVELQAGDVICTGSPAGVGFVRGAFLRPGDVVEITVGSLPPLRTTFGAEQSPRRD